MTGGRTPDTSIEEVRVLHVDDDPDFLELARTFLKREDDRFTIETTTGASDGQAKLLDGDFDCVISDYEMPKTDGLEFLQTVREDYPDLPFILYTGKGSEEVASDAISAGVTEYLQKESGTGQYTVLANRVRNAVEKYRTQVELADREKRLDLFFEQSPLGVIRWDECFDVARVNDAAEEILGYPEAELAGESWERIVPESDQEMVGEVVSNLLADKGGYHSINENVRRDGERIICEWHNRVVTDETGAVVAIFSQFQDITDRRERQRDLEETKRRLELALEATDTGVWEWDLQTDEVVWNSTLERVMEFDPGDFDGTLDAFIELVHPEDLPKVQDELDEAINTDSTYQTEFRMIDNQGDVRWVAVRGRLVDDGDSERMVGVHQDITERKELESELAVKAEQYRTLVENLPDGGVFLYNEALECVRAGGAGLTDIGLTPADVEGERPSDRYPAELAEEIEANLRSTFDGNRKIFEQSYNGRHYQIRTLPVRDATGTITQVMAVSIEITERKEHERKLTALHDVAADLDTIDSVDRICERTIEASETILEFDLSAIDIEQQGQLEKRAASTELPADRLTTMSTDEGIAGKTYRTNESFLIDEIADHEVATSQGQYESAISVPIGDHGVFQAVAKREGAFSESDRALAELLVSHTDSALSRVKREQQLKEQNDRLEEFVSIVSHDLRSPLTTARGRLELAQLDDDDAHLEDATNAVDRSLTLIEDLLRLAREGEQLGRTEPIDLATTVNESWRTVETAAADLCIETDRTIQADRSRFKQLFENLFRNAIDHGGPDVTVTVGDLDDGFYVADDGPGIPENQREHVFEAGHSSVDNSTGFGLHIVEKIAVAHGWDVAVTESSGGGTRIEFTNVESRPAS
ncbi:MAG: PAS domain S-box protein [Halobacteriales archaeon]|nr:PAS domain S-box protein [Halobacteriales archaeon]